MATKAAFLEEKWIPPDSRTEKRHKDQLYIKARIDKTQQNSKYWLCGDRDQTTKKNYKRMQQIGAKEYKTRHDWVGKVIHWELWKKLKFEHVNKWYIHNTETTSRTRHANFSGFWHTSGQTVRPSSNQQKTDNRPNCGLCHLSRSQSKIEGRQKER